MPGGHNLVGYLLVKDISVIGRDYFAVWPSRGHRGQDLVLSRSWGQFYIVQQVISMKLSLVTENGRMYI